MFCPKCGSEEYGTYCAKCGTKLEEQAIASNGVSWEEKELIEEIHRKRKKVYIAAGAIIVLFLAVIIMSVIGKIKSDIEKNREEILEIYEAFRNEKEEKAKQEEIEKREAMSPEEKRNEYYYQILEEYQKAEKDELQGEPQWVNEHYLKECDFTSENPPVCAALLDLCGDNSPELIISKYSETDQKYIIIDMYGFENGKSSQIFAESAMGYGYNCFICQNGQIKVEENSLGALVSVSYYSVEYAGTEPVLSERVFEESKRYYYGSGENSEQEITKTEYEEFLNQYPLLSNIKWNQLSYWKNPNG